MNGAVPPPVCSHGLHRNNFILVMNAYWGVEVELNSFFSTRAHDRCQLTFRAPPLSNKVKETAAPVGYQAVYPPSDPRRRFSRCEE